GAHLPHAVAQGDHVGDTPAQALVEVGAAVARDVDAPRGHHPHGRRVERLGVAARAGHLDRAAGMVDEEALGHLRAGRVAGTEEEHRRAEGLVEPARARTLRHAPGAGMQRRSRRGEQPGARAEVDPVVGVAPVGRALPRRDEAPATQLTQVVRDEVLRFAETRAQLPHPQVALRQLGQHAPPVGMADELQAFGRRDRRDAGHESDNTSNCFDISTESTGRLARRLSTGDAAAIGRGAMVGAGVFAAPGPAAAAAGSWLLVGLALAALVAYANATSSAQLAALHPESGGTYVYARHHLGAYWGFLAGWSFVVGKTASLAAMTLTFGAYVDPDLARPLGIGAVVALTTVNLLGVEKTAGLTRVLLAAVLAALAVVAASAVLATDGDTSRLTGDLQSGWWGVLRSAGLLLFAFAG